VIWAAKPDALQRAMLLPLDMFRRMTNNSPGIFYGIYLLAAILVIDAALAKIFWKRLSTHPAYFTIGVRRGDPFYHHSLERNVKAVQQWGERIYPFATNSLGFRDSEVRDVSLNTDRQRIVLIGDSFTEGVGLSFEKTFAGLIGKNLGEKNIEVLNAGVTTYSPKLYYLKIKYLTEQLKLKFDKLVVFLDMSDIQDELIYKKYTAGDMVLPRHLGHFLRLYAIRHSVIGNLIDRAVRQAVREGTMDVADRTLNEIIKGYDTFADHIYHRSGWYAEPSYSAWGAEGAALAEHYMSELATLCKINGIEMIVAVYPWPRQVDERIVENGHVLYWRKFSELHGIKFLNLFPLFMKEDADTVIRWYYMEDNMHYNEAGNRLVAEGFLRWYANKR